MIGEIRSWCVEHRDRRILFVSDTVTDLFADSEATGFRTSRSQPAWKVVLSLEGEVEIFPRSGGSVRGRGVIIPPRFPRTSFFSGGRHLTLFTDPWRVAPHTSATIGVLDRRACQRILDAFRPDQTADLDEGRRALRPFLCPARPLDSRVEYALENLTGVDMLKDLAADVGLSSARLRALVHDAVGIPLIHLRHWARLRAAVASMDKGLAVAAQRAGFSDQAHFTRIARQLLGRTPGSLLSPQGHTPREDLVRLSRAIARS